ncbi:MAG: sugar ABC transporter substrate-binding protein [Arachnia sp.]
MSQRRALRRVAAAGIATALALLSACAGGGGNEPKQEEKVTSLTIIAANSPFTAGLQPLLDKYKEETGVTVTLEPYGNEQLNDTLKVKLNAQSADFDIYGYQVQDLIREFTRNGWLEDLSSRVTSDAAWKWDDFQESSRDAVTLDGKVYGVPVMTERHIVYYRADLLQEAGLQPPTTLEELEAIAKQLHRPADGFYGIAMRGARVPMITQYSSFLYSYGGDFQDETGKTATVNTPEAIAAYETYGRLLREYGPPGATNMGWVEASAIFAQGNAAFYLDADSQAYTFLDETKSSVGDKVGYARFPAGPAGSKPYNIVPQTLGINAFSTKKDAAWEFVKWITNEANSKTLMADATVPVARASAWADDAAASKFPAGLVEIVRGVDADYVGHDRPSLEAVARAREFVGGPGVTAIEGGDVKAAAEQANKDFQALLDSENK